MTVSIMSYCKYENSQITSNTIIFDDDIMSWLPYKKLESLWNFLKYCWIVNQVYMMHLWRRLTTENKHYIRSTFLTFC